MKLEVVCGILIENNKIFIQQKGYGKYKGKWEFPGGKVEAFETLEQALIREIQEELNVTCEIQEYFKTFIHDYEEFQVHLHVYFISIRKGNLTCTEQLELRFVSLEELDQMDWLEGNYEMIACLKQYLGPIFKEKQCL